MPIRFRSKQTSNDDFYWNFSDVTSRLTMSILERKKVIANAFAHPASIPLIFTAGYAEDGAGGVLLPLRVEPEGAEGISLPRAKCGYDSAFPLLRCCLR
jgi:hypothetical protein